MFHLNIFFFPLTFLVIMFLVLIVPSVAPCFSHPHTGKKFCAMNRITCKSKYIVYLLKCGLGYIGKTKRELKTRISEHKYSIRNKDEKSREPDILTLLAKMSAHSNFMESSPSEEVVIEINYYCKEKPNGHISYTYHQTESPQGLNEEPSVVSFD